MKISITMIIVLFLFLLFPCHDVLAFISPNPAYFEKVQADSTNQITWTSVQGTNNPPIGTIYYRFKGAMGSSGWKLDRNESRTNLYQNTRFYAKVQMSNNITHETTVWSTNLYCYTLLEAPLDSSVSVVPLSYDRMRVAVTQPANYNQGLTGSRFSNFTGSGQGGANSPALTGIYVYTNYNLLPNTRYSYRAQYKNGDGVWTLGNPKQITNITLCRVPGTPTLQCLSSNSINVVIDTNQNPSATRYAVRFIGGGSTRYVQGNKTLGATPFYQTLLIWNPLDVTNLSPNTAYTVSVSAQNLSNYNTSYGPSAVRYTAPNIPRQPAVILPGGTATKLKIDINANGNPPYTVYSIRVKFGQTRYVQNGGTLGLTPVYDTEANWEPLTNTGLSANTSYTVSVNAINGDTSYTTSYSKSSNRYTEAYSASQPSVLANYDLDTNYFTSVTIEPNGNPTYTRFAIYCTNNNQYLQGDGSSSSTPFYQTESWWETSFRNYHTSGVSPNTYYGYTVIAQNQDSVSSPASSVGHDLTPPAAPVGVSVLEVNDDYLSVKWNKTAGANDYRIYYANVWGQPLTNYILLDFTAQTNYADERDGGVPDQVTGLVVTNTSSTDTSRLKIRWNAVSPPSPSIEYYYRIRARKADGKEGAFSSSYSGAINITPVISHFKIFRETSWSNTVLSTSFTDSGLSANSVYHYQAQAVSSDDLSGVKSTWGSNYTAIQKPAGITFAQVSSNFIRVNASGSFNNLTVKNSGLFFSNETNTDTSGWVQVNNWISSSLVANKRYGFRAMARNAEGLQTPWCLLTNRFTLCKVPLNPDITTILTNRLVIAIKSNKNPIYTQYAISNVPAKQFVQIDGTLNNSPQWGTYTQWRGSNGVTNYNLIPSSNYSYTVKARNGDDLSTVSSRTSLWWFTLPRIPESLRSTYNSLTNIILQWHDSGASYFGIECALDAGGFPGTFIFLKQYVDRYTSTNYNHSGLFPGTKYWYRIRGYNGNGVMTSPGPMISILTVMTNPETPTNFRGTAVATNAILWQWNDVSFSENYYIVRDRITGADVSPLLPTDTTSYLETNLLKNAPYTRYAVGSNLYGRSLDSNTNLTFTYAPAAFNLSAQLLSQDELGSAVQLIWNANSVTSFGIERACSVSGQPGNWISLASNVTAFSYNDSTADMSNTYYYRIASFNLQGVKNTNRSLFVEIFVPLFQRPKEDMISDNYITPEDDCVEILHKAGHAGQLCINIYSVSGRLVKALVDGHVSSADHYFKWYIDNDEGNRISRGIYFIYIKGNGVDEVRKVFVAR
ncbi:MAG: hypothetical protein JW827_02880 [Spirochaetes bacterium]|nr:hypothetical protein [Spirochaetota bacterium]